MITCRTTTCLHCGKELQSWADYWIDDIGAFKCASAPDLWHKPHPEISIEEAIAGLEVIVTDLA